jgi:uracil-DNA glycosylase family 4
MAKNLPRATPQSAAQFVPPKPTLRTAKQAAADCKGCDLYRRATQTVFVKVELTLSSCSSANSRAMQETWRASRLSAQLAECSTRALEAVGIVRDQVYVTNVVKHFKWEPRGKRRIHAKPRISEIRACRPWLDTELALIKPRALVCLGATAAQALLGSAFKVSTQRGKFVESPLAPVVMATVHPSSVLRSQTDDERRVAMEAFVADLRTLAKKLSG